MCCPLSVVLTVDHEKDTDLLSAFLGSMRHLNAADRLPVQFIALVQSRNVDDVRRRVKAANLDVQVVASAMAHVNGGQPIWDMHYSLRQVWPEIKGEYVTFQHTEFLWGHNRLRRTIEWLMDCRPIIALGNLCRLGADRSSGHWYRTDDIPEHSVPICDAIRNNDWAGVSERIDTSVPGWWVYWDDCPKVGDTKWKEDIFFVRRDFLDCLHYTEHGGFLPFQDVYDIMGWLINELGVLKIKVPCIRMAHSIHKAVHLWHAKTWGYLSSHVRDWFLLRRERWHGLVYGDPSWWADAIGKTGDDLEKQVVISRRSNRGTLMQFNRDLRRWLIHDGGADHVRQYLEVS